MPTWADLLAEGRSLLSFPSCAPYEAEELLAFAAGRPRAWFHARRREEADSDDAARFLALVGRRAAGEPLQYLLGEWEFLGRTFRVDPRALIPRGETEAIVEMARAAAPAASAILDAGTGSGILAVSLAVERPGARIVAVDRSEAALALAQTNARLHGVSGRVSFVASDWLSGLAPRPFFDLAVANPPTSRASTRRTSTGPSPTTSRISPSSAATTASTPSASSSGSSPKGSNPERRSSSRSATGRPAR
ncbi:MAG: peptide chain release factor N(5)-glutamine methyltransferase [Holophagales bacterium]|nr:peptide chain release factor N(5)-glutamine methyltransferase [Holophagales bacterium]